MASEVPLLPGSRLSTTIFSLPDEILLEIFTMVKMYRPGNKALHHRFASSSSDVAAVRLTCRRFAATSSHLLVHYIRLDGINSHSLEKLEAISRHQLIRKGVQIIRVELRYYVPNLAHSIEQFTRWAVRRVWELARRLREAFEDEVERNAEYGNGDNIKGQLQKRDELARLLRRLKATLESWTSTSVEEWQHLPVCQQGEIGKYGWQRQESEAGSCDESQAYITLLREAHDLYQRRCDDQERLRKDDAFAARFAAAMSRMPNAKCLELQDFHYESDVQETKEHAGLLEVNSLVEPMSWGERGGDSLDNPPSELLFTLPLAIQKVSCKLDSILMRTTTQAENYFPLLRNSIHHDFAALGCAIQEMGLKSFAFVHGTNSKARRRETPALEQEQDLTSFKRYITAMTSSSSLERFRLAVGSDWVHSSLDRDDTLDFGGLLIPKSCQRLSDLHITGLSIRLDDLTSFHNLLWSNNMRLEFLTLAGVKLVSGTWTEALEMLRKMDIADKEVLEPTGVECDSLIMSLGSGYEEIFGMNPGCVNEAGRFINGQIKQNPLKSVRCI